MAMSYSLDKGEFFYYVECLEKLGYIIHPDNRNLIGYQLTPEAWKYLEEHKTKDRTRSDRAFIAIDFDKKYESTYKVIEASVNEAGYKSIRADKGHHSEYIMDWIINQIKEARFIVAELTSKNLGVYYEFGYAKAQDIPIIACLKKLKGESNEKALKKVHFDLKQFPIIIYESPDKQDLGEKVINRILNLVGRRG
jgi:nucleoside 2-deoxyribosyltransferase